jgi:hypothetical protein
MPTIRVEIGEWEHGMCLEVDVPEISLRCAKIALNRGHAELKELQERGELGMKDYPEKTQPDELLEMTLLCPDVLVADMHKRYMRLQETVRKASQNYLHQAKFGTKTQNITSYANQIAKEMYDFAEWLEKAAKRWTG